MLTIAGLIAFVAVLLTNNGRFAVGSLLVFFAESFVGLLIIAALLGVFK